MSISKNPIQILITTILGFSLLLSTQGHVYGSITHDDIWTLQYVRAQEGSLEATSKTGQHPNRFRQQAFYHADTKRLSHKLAEAPHIEKKSSGLTGAILYLPMSDGTMIKAQVYQYSMMAAALQQKFPHIKTYKIYDAEGKRLLGHADISNRGFQLMFYHEQQLIFLEPASKQSEIVYYQTFQIKQKAAHQCTVLHHDNYPDDTNDNADGNDPQSASSWYPTQARQNGGELKKYRIAVMTTSEYASAVSADPSNPTVTETMEAIVTAINRVNQIFNRDFAIQLELVAGNNQLIYTDTEADPFTGNALEDINMITALIDDFIGNENYDIGHLFTVNGSGLAELQSVCRTQTKARALTGVFDTLLQTDAFYIDYLAHEIGHQFGANHIFNGTSGSCGGGNRNPSTAFEPGSGSTIMAYPGICGAENLQTTTDAYFHAGSIEEVLNFVSSSAGDCYESVPTGDTPPTVDTDGTYIIPALTPFRLTATANDINGGNIHYTWEQMDVGSSSSNPSSVCTDNGSRPLFRSFFGSNNPTRFFPKFNHVLNQVLCTDTNEMGNGINAETLASTDRTLNFRVTVRANEYGIDSVNQQVIVESKAGPFSVREPQQNTYHFSSSETIALWDVSETNKSPVNCQQVNILLTTDDEPAFSSFETILNNAGNNGRAIVTLPPETSDKARLLVECSNNIFYGINNGNFNIIEDDNIISLISIFSETPALPEGDNRETRFIFHIFRTGNIASIASVDFKIMGAGRHPASEENFIDSQTMSGSIDFLSNEDFKILEVFVKDDSDAGKDETFVVHLENPTGAFLSTASAYALIKNDDKKQDAENPDIKIKKKSNGFLGSLHLWQFLYLLMGFSISHRLKNRKSIFFIIISATLLSTCIQHGPSREPDNPEVTVPPIPETGKETIYPQITALLWVKNANPQQDLKTNIKRNDLRYQAYRSRQGLIIPGIAIENHPASKRHIKLQDGMGDVIFSEEHYQLMLKFSEYAEQYNKLLYQHLR